jgi:hypothetical protein
VLVWVVMVEDEEEEAGRNEAELASLLLTCNHLLCVRMSDDCRDSDRNSRSITLDAHSHSQHLASTQGRKKAHTLTLSLLSLPSLSFPYSLCSRSASPRPVTSSVDAPVSVLERGLGLILRFRRTTFRLAVSRFVPDSTLSFIAPDHPMRTTLALRSSSSVVVNRSLSAPYGDEGVIHLLFPPLRLDDFPHVRAIGLERCSASPSSYRSSPCILLKRYDR